MKYQISSFPQLLRFLKSLFPSPVRLQLKKMELAYIVEKVIKEDVPKLHHGSDGLIYTNAETGYVVGTDPTLYVLFHHFLFSGVPHDTRTPQAPISTCR